MLLYSWSLGEDSFYLFPDTHYLKVSNVKGKVLKSLAGQYPYGQRLLLVNKRKTGLFSSSSSSYTLFNNLIPHLPPELHLRLALSINPRITTCIKVKALWKSLLCIYVLLQHLPRTLNPDPLLRLTRRWSHAMSYPWSTFFLMFR